MRYTPEQYEKKLKTWAKNSPEAIERGLNKAATEIIGTARTQHLSGPKMAWGKTGGFLRSTLAAPTGTLKGSLAKRVSVTAGKIIAQVGSNLKYARIHEYGGTIMAKGSGRLHFVVNGIHYTPKSVKIPERPYLRPSVDSQRKRTLQIISEEYIGAYNRG